MFHVKQSAAERLAQYRTLVERYHATLDLVSGRGLADFDRHLAEAGAYAEVVRDVSPARPTVLDVGSGVGLPGVAVACLVPHARVVLIERRRRRATFLQLVVGQLGLANVEVRCEDVRATRGVVADVVTAQAVAPFVHVYAWTRHAQAGTVVLVSRRGRSGSEEAATLRAELGCDIAVVAERSLGHRGTLVALRLPGGRACPSSG